jgi:Tfp pilus assembly protein PilN
MLRTNLSTRPFYNERAVHAIAVVAALVLVGVTAWQIGRVVRLSRYKTDLNAAIARDKTLIDRQSKEAAQIRRGLDQKELSAVAAAAKEANDLIEQRTFSWTALFNDLEATLPDDVMLTAVHPEFRDGVTQVNLSVQGRRSDDIDTFWDRLDKAGSFHDIQWSDVNVSEEGLHKIQMKAVYTPSHLAARPASVAPVPVVAAPAEETLGAPVLSAPGAERRGPAPAKRPGVKGSAR